jgi:hypothetical protein
MGVSASEVGLSAVNISRAVLSALKCGEEMAPSQVGSTDSTIIVNSGVTGPLRAR